jgi:dTDP-4-dehydrorhamnose 3,5-epimerase
MYDDPRLGLVWPFPVGEMSPKDAGWPLLADIEPELKRRMSLRETEIANV